MDGSIGQRRNRKMKCKKCGKEVEAGYNTPDGFFCSECWDKVSERKKKKLEREAMLCYARLGRILRL
jgi:tRNA(Ile2) C34 agmatinyltransferase TiaS